MSKKEVLEVAGAVCDGFHDKKGTPSGSNHASGDAGMFNHLPPGMGLHLYDQGIADVKRTGEMKVKHYVPGTPGFEGDGWDDNNGVGSVKY